MWNFSSGERAIALLVVMSISVSIFCVGGLPVNAQEIDRAEQLSKINASFEDKEPSVIAPTSSQIDILGPVGSGNFGRRAIPLPNGNIVVVDPLYDAPGLTDAGAVHLYNGGTGALISTLTGSIANGGVGGNITILTGGNYVVASPTWDTNTTLNVGAVTWCSSTTGCSGVVSSSNSLVGTVANDNVGTVFPLLNGNYVVLSSSWDNGAVSNAGAATWCDGAGGCTGPVTTANSFFGTGNAAGALAIATMQNSKYLVLSQSWSGVVTNGGAVTLCSGTGVCAGPFTTSNSLYGTTVGDQVGRSFSVLENGNYIIRSSLWNGVAADVGAITWCSGTTGCVGAVSSANSLVGSTLNDQVGGSTPGLEANGNYVVRTPLWNSGAVDVGAVTLCSGTVGCTGTISSANSLVGTTAGDQVGNASISILNNGNYVVASYLWDGTAADVGAVTWCSGTTGCTGPVAAANSLTGSSAGDNVGRGISGFSGPNTLVNGNYVVTSPLWDGAATDVGAVTYCNGTTGTTGIVSTSNSLVGTSTGDQVGNFGANGLDNGKYVVVSYLWNGTAVDVGAVTFCGNPSGCVGTVSAANSLVGSNAGDQIGFGSFLTLANGSYVVNSELWDGTAADVGAVTWCSGTNGCVGTVSAANSFVGSTAGDKIGNEDPDNIGVGNAVFTELPNGDYYFGSGKWDNGGTVDAGAVTYGSGNGGTAGTLNSQNSVLGTTSTRGPWLAVAFSNFNQKLVVGREGSNLYTIYTPDASGVDVSGRVLTSGGRGVRGAIVRLNEGPTVVRAVTTDAFGGYRFLSIASGHSYTITVAQRRFSFAPRAINPSGNLTDIDITASP